MKTRFLAYVGWVVLASFPLSACNAPPKNHLLPPAPPPPRMSVPAGDLYEPAPAPSPPAAAGAPKESVPPR